MPYYCLIRNNTGFEYNFFDVGDGSVGSQEDVDFLDTLINTQGMELTLMQLITSNLKDCFNIDYGFTTYDELAPNEDTNYYLVFNVTREQYHVAELVFSTSFVRNVEQNRLEIYNVCKTSLPSAKSFKVSYFLRDVILKYFEKGFRTIWLGVLFSNPNYERAVLSYLRAGFEIKYVSSIGGGSKSNYAGRLLNMEAHYGKNAFSTSDLNFILPKDEEAQYITIANNIKLVEYDALTHSTILLQPSAWKLFVKQVITKNKECGGIINKKLIPGEEPSIDKYTILMGCEGGEGQQEEECTTSQSFPYEINFHTHPISCYNKMYGINATNLGPPSVADYQVVFGNFVNGLSLFHMVVALEGIYVLQIHPYWKYMLSSNKISNECFESILFTINSINEAYFPMSYFTDMEETLKYANNLMSPNVILKRYSKVASNQSKVQAIKDQCLLYGINRNINLFICTFLQYPATETTIGGSLSNYIGVMKHQKLAFDKISLDNRAAVVKDFLNVGFFDVPIEIPYYIFDPSKLDQISRL